MNASKHLVFASEIVSQHEDQDLFNQLLERLINELNPETQIESSIVERIAANVWRERRLAIAERKWINQTYQNQNSSERSMISLKGDLESKTRNQQILITDCFQSSSNS